MKLASFINERFAREPLLAEVLPVDGRMTDSFFAAWSDGKLLAVLADAAQEGAVDLESLRRQTQKPLGVRSRNVKSNNFAAVSGVLGACRGMTGLKLKHVGAEDFVQGNRCEEGGRDP